MRARLLLLLLRRQCDQIGRNFPVPAEIFERWA
jgi:hypothetical protein